MSKIIKDFDELQEQAFLGYGDLYIAVAKIAWQARQPEIDVLKAELKEAKDSLDLIANITGRLRK